jgi:hypothetical protein
MAQAASDEDTDCKENDKFYPSRKREAAIDSE